MKKAAILVIALSLSLMGCASSQKKLQMAKEKDPQYQYSMGAVHLNNNNLDEAIRFFNKALSLDPRHHQSMNALGLVYSMKGDLREAERYFHKCLEVAPSFTEAHNNLGMVFQEMGFPDRAEEEFKKVIADPNYGHKELPYYNLARLYSLRQNWDMALFFVDKAVQTNSRYHLGYNLRGYILEVQGKLPAAIESYKQALKLLPSDISYKFSLAAAHFKNNDLREAEEILAEILPLISDPGMKEQAESYLKAIKEKEKQKP